MRECEWGEGESLNYGVIWCMIVIMMMRMKVVSRRKGRGYKEEKMWKGEKEEKGKIENPKERRFLLKWSSFFQTTKEQ